MTSESNNPLLILAAGPYRSGTNDIPELIEAAGSKKVGDVIFNEIFHPTSIKLIDHCDAVLRIGGVSADADEMVNTGKAKGKVIFKDRTQIPKVIIQQTE
jgi:hypothetical protein